VQNIKQMFKSVMSVGLRRRHFPNGDGADILARSASPHARDVILAREARRHCPVWRACNPATGLTSEFFSAEP
jgi:hypothetical protein